ncbi:glycoside hydrolase family 15 protein [Candidatus Saccharibacteria bacterium]|nr:glycoside hydrolase family 15 protein [Candidatus Saccharibacteria bacterium]
MGRPVVLSNGQLFVGLDENGLVHDFYYPYVGLDNLTNARNSQHKIGVWVNGTFSWVERHRGWDISVDFEEEALVSKVRMHNEALKVTIQTCDFVDPEFNAFIRHVTVANEADEEQDIRLFLHQVFQISRAGRADTALYVPDDNYILDYKGRCCLLISGKHTDDGDFDQFAVGSFRIEGKDGTYKDAEDGELSGNAVEHGGVDSVLRFRRQVAAGDSFGVDYWVVAADSQTDAENVHEKIKRLSVVARLQKAREHWHNWLAPALDRIKTLPEIQQAMVKKSLLIIKAHCDERGSILASGDSSIFNYGRDYYCYCWPRDAAYAIWPLMRLGIYGEARAFFEFARSTLHRDGYLMHKYQPDRAIGSTWHPLIHNRRRELAIQEDETAIVLFMLGEYYRFSKDTRLVESFYDTLIEPAAEFLGKFIDDSTGLPHASYDLWEEKFLTTTYTVSVVIAALESASQLATICNHPDDASRWKRVAESIRGHLQTFYHPDGYFRKGFLLQENGNVAYDDTIDISNLYGPYMYIELPMDDERMKNTLNKVKEQLYNTSPIGGVIRYKGDNYFLSKRQYPGNPWIVCTLWLAQYLNAAGERDQARALLAWVQDRAMPSGALSEQFDPETGEPLSVAPLVWSHAEFINTALDIADVK